MAGKVASEPQMNTSSIHLVAVNSIGMVAGLMLLFSGLGHLSNMHLFLDSVHRYQILPSWLVPYAASTLPPLTTVCGMSLIAGQLQRVGFLVAACLFSCFAIAQLTQLLSTGQPIDCGCFVWLEHKTSFVNVILLASAAFVTLFIGLKYFVFAGQFGGKSSSIS